MARKPSNGRRVPVTPNLTQGITPTAIEDDLLWQDFLAELARKEQEKYDQMSNLGKLGYNAKKTYMNILDPFIVGQDTRTLIDAMRYNAENKDIYSPNSGGTGYANAYNPMNKYSAPQKYMMDQIGLMGEAALRSGAASLYGGDAVANLIGLNQLTGNQPRSMKDNALSAAWLALNFVPMGKAAKTAGKAILGMGKKGQIQPEITKQDLMRANLPKRDSRSRKTKKP